MNGRPDWPPDSIGIGFARAEYRLLRSGNGNHAARGDLLHAAVTETVDSVLVPGRTCWRMEAAERFALIIDAADYFRYAKAAMLKAGSRIMLIGWDFDVRIRFEREGQTLEGPSQLARRDSGY